MSTITTETSEDGTTTTTTTTTTSAATAPPAMAGGSDAAAPSLTADQHRILHECVVMNGPGRSAAWAPATSEVPEDPVGPAGFGKGVFLVERPPVGGKPIPHSCVKIEDRPVPASAAPGTAIVKNEFFSLEPSHRIWMSAMDGYMPAIGLNTVIRCFTIGTVVMSSDESKLAVGAQVSTFGGVQEYTLVNLKTDLGVVVNPIVPKVPATYTMSLFAVAAGLTAWLGTRMIAKPQPGETFVVSGGAGNVGSIAGQLAKAAGARVIGIAGSSEKVRWMTEDLGFDAGINYKTENVAETLAKAAPGGVDCYFDNVGGETLDIVLDQMKLFGRIAMCGCISAYTNDGVSETGCKNLFKILTKRLEMRGFICMDHVSAMGEAMAEIGQLLQEGKMQVNEDIREVGIDGFIDTVNLLYTGGNSGKLIMKIPQ